MPVIANHPFVAPVVDVRALHAMLDRARRRRDLSWRALAKELGLVASTMSRMEDGRHPDLAAFATMITWLGVPAETFYRQTESKGAP